MILTRPTICRCGQPLDAVRVTMTIDGVRVTLCGVCAREVYEKRKDGEKGAA